MKLANFLSLHSSKQTPLALAANPFAMKFTVIIRQKTNHFLAVVAWKRRKGLFAVGHLQA